MPPIAVMALWITSSTFGADAGGAVLAKSRAKGSNSIVEFSQCVRTDVIAPVKSFFVWEK
jgi:hypothetical protein